MINKEEFLKTCNLTEDDLTAARISWEELTEIYEDYMSKTKLFRHLGKEFVDEYIKPVIEENKDLLGIKAEINV